MSHENLVSLSSQNFHLKECLGKLLFRSLKRRSFSEIINVSAETGEVLTCGKVLDDSIRATAVLRELGLRKGDVISVAAENTINYCVILLAALYIGLTVNPLNPEYLAAELEHALLISKPKVVIASKTAINILLAFKNKLKFINEVVLFTGECVEGHNFKLFERMLDCVEVDIDSFVPEELDYSTQNVFILLSSGTTGLPKGVPLTSQNLERTLKCFGDPKYCGMALTDCALLVLPLFHIFGLMVQIAAIINSTKIILLAKFKPQLFLESLEKYKITKLFVVPPLLVFLAKSPLVLNYDISSLKFVMIGGGSLSKEVQKEVKERLKNVDIRQTYGTTETGLCLFQTFDMTDTSSVGPLVPDMEGMIWDQNRKQRLGPGQTGELCFRGRVIIKGYLSGEPLIEDFVDEEGFWHSGDLGYYDEQGYFYIIDRIKELIKYKGFQVSPAELEVLIMSHSKVKDCAVIGIPDERHGQLPLAYVVVEDNAHATQQEITDYVAERISVQKHLHGGVIFIDGIPKTASGKVARKQLLAIHNETFNQKL